MRKWMNDRGYTMELYKRMDGSHWLTIRRADHQSFNHHYEWWQSDRAQADADLLAAACELEEVCPNAA